LLTAAVFLIGNDYFAFLGPKISVYDCYCAAQLFSLSASTWWVCCLLALRDGFTSSRQLSIGLLRGLTAVILAGLGLLAMTNVNILLDDSFSISCPYFLCLPDEQNSLPSICRCHSPPQSERKLVQVVFCDQFLFVAQAFTAVWAGTSL
jgi:hypothetical protein